MSASIDRVREAYGRTVDRPLYDEVRGLWKRHSIAEDRRDLDGLIATLTPDCRYELVQFARVWQGHAGARAFYTELLGAFPDVDFALENIVIGPQGVFEEARMTATWSGAWLGRAPTGGTIATRVLIVFPWDPEARRFRGERVFVDTPEAIGGGVT